MMSPRLRLDTLLRQTLSPAAKILDLKGRLRCCGCGRKGRAVVSVKWRGQGARSRRGPFSAPPQRRHVVKSTMRACASGTDPVRPTLRRALALGFRSRRASGATRRRYPRVPGGDRRGPGRNGPIGFVWGRHFPEQHYRPGPVGCARGRRARAGIARAVVGCPCRVWRAGRHSEAQASIVENGRR